MTERAVVLDLEGVTTKHDISDDMLYACMSDMVPRVTLTRFAFECRHTAALAWLLQERIVYLDGPHGDWNWILTETGLKLYSSLKALRDSRDSEAEKKKCPLCLMGFESKEVGFIPVIVEGALMSMRIDNPSHDKRMSLHNPNHPWRKGNPDV